MTAPSYQVFQGEAKHAKAAGWKFYRTGRLCIRGHDSRRRVKDQQCIECNNTFSAAKARAYQKKHPIRRRIAKTRSRCKILGLPFDEAAYRAAWRERGTTCPIFGTAFVDAIGKNTGGPDTPEMDRIIPELGYVRGNMWVISHRANTIKNNASWQEIMQVGAAVREKVEDEHQVPEFWAANSETEAVPV